MYSKCVAACLGAVARLWAELLGMFQGAPGGREALYAFRAFRFEEVKPRSRRNHPHPRSGHRIGADSANFYSFGGYNPTIHNPNLSSDSEDDGFLVLSYPLFQELWRFNFATRQWMKFKISDSLPLELASNAVLLHKNTLMVYGGTGSPFGFRCSNQLYICNVNNETSPMEEVLTSGQWPIPCYGQALVLHNEYLYTIGGTTGLEYTCDIHRLNLRKLIWEAVYICCGKGDYEPEGRYRHEVAFDGRQIYVFGGGTSEVAFDLQFIPTFNLDKNLWHKVPTFADSIRGVPAPRRCHGAVQIDSDSGVQVFISGGHDGENVFSDLWKLDLVTMRWSCFDFSSLPIGTYFHATAASPEGKIYVFGGINSVNEDVARSNKIYSTWLCIPKLSEMCWEAVLHYSPHIVNSDVNDLIDIGLPRHFIQRIGKKAKKKAVK